MAFKEALVKLIEEQPETISSALIATVALSKEQPDLIDLNLFEGSSEEVNEAFSIVGGALTFLSTMGVLPSDDIAESLYEVAADDLLRFTLMSTARLVMDDMANDPELSADIDELMQQAGLKEAS